MTKSGLIRAVAGRFSHLSARDVEIVVNTLFDSMTAALARGQRIEVRGFGSFTVRKRRERLGRNPKTGEAIGVDAKCVPFFTVGNELRERVNGCEAVESRDTPAAHRVATPEFCRDAAFGP